MPTLHYCKTIFSFFFSSLHRTVIIPLVSILASLSIVVHGGQREERLVRARHLEVAHAPGLPSHVTRLRHGESPGDKHLLHLTNETLVKSIGYLIIALYITMYVYCINIIR